VTVKVYADALLTRVLAGETEQVMDAAYIRVERVVELISTLALLNTLKTIF